MDNQMGNYLVIFFGESRKLLQAQGGSLLWHYEDILFGKEWKSFRAVNSLRC